MTDPEMRLAEEDVQKVLARALELEAQSAQGLTVAQIRALASELGIPESALDQALSEHRQSAAARSALDLASTAATAVLQRHRDPRMRMVMLSVGIAGSSLLLLVILSMMVRLFP